jgi:hypothetical protein
MEVSVSQQRRKRAQSILRKALFATSLCAAMLPRASAAGAEGDEAQRLFNEGRDALKRGDQPGACSKFRSSLALARVANTLFNVAQCDERDGKLALALQGWREGVLLLGSDDERLAVAKERLGALEARVPKVTLVTSSELPAGARVLVDGAAIPLPEKGAALTLDPGEHAIAVETAGRATFRTTVTVAERDRTEVAISAGAPLYPAASSAATAVSTQPPPQAGGNTRRTFGFIAGAAGLAGLAAFGVTGGILIERDGRIRDACPNKACSPEGRDLIQGNPPLMIANAVSLGAGVVGLGLGTVLLLTSGGENKVGAALAPVALPGGGGASITGNF